MKSTKRKLIQLFGELNKLSKIGKAKSKYGALKNIKIINNEIDILKEIEKDSSAIIESFTKEKNEVITKYGTVNSQGYTSINPDNENLGIATKEIKALEEKYKSELEEYTKQINEYNTILNEEVEFDFTLYEISIDDIPDDIDDLKILMDFEIVK